MISIYNKNTGQIVRSCDCTNDLIEYQYDKNTESFIYGNFEINEWYVDNDIAIKMPAKPDGAAYFNYDTKQWVLDYPNQEVIVKNQRDKLLYESDWTQIPNNPLTTAKQQEWAVYRQELRDITSQSGYPFNVIWPVQPQ